MRASARPSVSIRALLGIMLALDLSATAQAASANSAEQEPIATARIEPAPSDRPVMPATSPAKLPAVPMTTSEQIDAYLRASPTTPWQDAEALDRQEERPPRQVHGQVGVAVGTGGYRSAYGQSDIPVGRDGNLSVFVQRTQGGRGHGYGYGSGYRNGYGYGGHSGQSLGLSLDFSGSAWAADCRQGGWNRPARRGEHAQSQLNGCARPGWPLMGGNEPRTLPWNLLARRPSSGSGQQANCTST